MEHLLHRLYGVDAPGSTSDPVSTWVGDRRWGNQTISVYNQPPTVGHLSFPSLLGRLIVY